MENIKWSIMMEKLKQYKNKNIHIVGIGGAEGSAIAEFLVENGITSITGHDFSSSITEFEKNFSNTHLSLGQKDRKIAFEHLLNLPIKINFRSDYLKEIKKAELIFVSQVWFKYSQNMPILERIKNSEVPFKTITNLYFELTPCPIISVTGTNGKTTTSRLINSIFQKWEKKNENSKVYFAGNDRQNVQVLDRLKEMKENDILILETSSTQLLLNSGISPHIGVITNISPNHIEDHGSFENYIEAKKNLIRFQKEGDFAVLNYDNDVTGEIIGEFRKNSFPFSRKEKLGEGCFVEDGKIKVRKAGQETYIMDIKEIKIPGDHNIENVLAAVSCAYLSGVNSEIIREGISEYSGIKHRLKLLYNIEGTRYYDDTQATTPEATIAGINSFEGGVVLMFGGDDKGMQYELLAKEIDSKVDFLILFPGSASEKIENLINKDKTNFSKVENLSEAIQCLRKYLENKKNTVPIMDNVVLFSPGAAHFYSKFVENSKKDLKSWVKEVYK